MVGSGDQVEVRASFLDGLTLTAPAMIVTIYGDIVVPRGGVLWIGNLIEICAAFGISETQVRTAVSRLVSAGRLTGIRDGRRSYYQLAEAARDEFDLAARLLFEPLAPARGWTIVHARPSTPEAPRGRHFAALGNGLFIGPDHAPQPFGPAAIVFNASLAQGAADMSELVHSLWPLEAYATEYRSFIDRFRPLLEERRESAHHGGTDAVMLRLLLVHLYRHVLLADPQLPDDVMPANWPGPESRALFATAYLELSKHADPAIGTLFEGRDAPLPATTMETERRLKGLRTIAGL